MPAVVAGGEVWVLGGLTDNLFGFSGSDVVEIYEPSSDQWTSGPDLPAPRHHAMAAVAGGEIYVIGGMDANSFAPTDTMWRLREGTWEELAPLPGPRAAGAAVGDESSIYLIGGVPDGTSVLRFDLDTGEWFVLPSLGRPREHVSAAIHGDQIVVVGGRWGSDMHASTEVYEFVTDRWIEGPALLEARSGFALVTSDAGLMAIGGEVFNPTAVLASTERLLDGTWSPGPELPEALHGVPAVEVEGTVLVIGGSLRAGDVENSGEVWAVAVSSIP
jgi:N-acetylneuraminic acid mutarotase